jgi:pilus assembly protein CpaE
MEPNIIRCALVSGDQQFRASAEQVLTDPTGLADFVAEVPVPASEFPKSSLEELFAADPEVVFLDLGDDPSDGIQTLRTIAEAAPEIVVIPAGPPIGAEALLEVMRSGASEYLPKPVSEEDVTAALSRAARKLGGVQPRERREEAHTLGVLSAKGGVGVTTVATNLAVGLRRMSTSRTLLLDLNPELGTAAPMLGMQPRYSFLDLIRNFHRLDEELLDSYLEHHDSGVFFLSSPDRREETEGLTEKHIRVLLHFLRGHFDYIVIDLGRGISALSSAALEQCDECLLVATPELPTLRNVKRILPSVRVGPQGSMGPVRLILNEYRQEGEITTSQVEEVLGVDVAFTLQKDDEALQHSINAGRPVVLNGKSRYSKDIQDLTVQISGRDAGDASGGAISRAFSAVFRRRSSRSEPKEK